MTHHTNVSCTICGANHHPVNDKEFLQVNDQMYCSLYCIRAAMKADAELLRFIPDTRDKMSRWFASMYSGGDTRVCKTCDPHGQKQSSEPRPLAEFLHPNTYVCSYECAHKRLDALKYQDCKGYWLGNTCPRCIHCKATFRQKCDGDFSYLSVKDGSGLFCSEPCLTSFLGSKEGRNQLLWRKNRANRSEHGIVYPNVECCMGKRHKTHEYITLGGSYDSMVDSYMEGPNAYCSVQCLRSYLQKWCKGHDSKGSREIRPDGLGRTDGPLNPKE